MADKESIMPSERVESRIYLIHGVKVVLDEDLASLYEVEVKALNQAVKRNIKRFPEDFMFQLSPEEIDILRSQTGTASWGGRRTPPYAFTEHGMAMLSGILRSERAVLVNIEIMRAFVRLRKMVAENVELSRMLAALERKNDEQFKVVFIAIRPPMENEERPKRKIGISVRAE